MWGRGIAPHILNLDTVLRVIGQFHAPSAFTPGERAPRTHWIGGWLNPRAGLDAVAKRKIPFSPLSEMEIRSSNS